MFNMSFKLSGVKEAMEKFDPRKVNKAIGVTLNETIRAVRTATSKKIREGYAIKKRDLDAAMKIKLAKSGEMSATIEVSGRPIAASKFGTPRQTGKRGRPHRGSTHAGGGTLVQTYAGKVRRLIPHAFIATMKSGHKGVWKRDMARKRPSIIGKRGKPIKGKAYLEEIYGPSIPQLFWNRVVKPVIYKTVNETWQKRFMHHVERLTGGKG